jgi:hypothetical protein
LLVPIWLEYAVPERAPDRFLAFRVALKTSSVWTTCGRGV